MQAVLGKFQWHQRPTADEQIDYRVQRALDAGVVIDGRRVLELGCGEGSLTRSLCECGADVWAFDVRLGNLVRAFARCAYHGHSPRFRLADARFLATWWTDCDLVWHCGLLYHLVDPRAHLDSLLAVAPQVVLDTHVAPDDAGEDGLWWDEQDDDRSGLPGQERSLWLTRATLMTIADRAGFHADVLIDDPGAPVGHRVLWRLRRRLR